MFVTVFICRPRGPHDILKWLTQKILNWHLETDFVQHVIYYTNSTIHTCNGQSINTFPQLFLSLHGSDSVTSSGASGWAGVADSATVADGVEEATVTGVTGVAAGQRVTQTRLLVRDAAPRWTHGPTLQLQGCWGVLTQGNSTCELGERKLQHFCAGEFCEFFESVGPTSS